MAPSIISDRPEEERSPGNSAQVAINRILNEGDERREPCVIAAQGSVKRAESLRLSPETRWRASGLCSSASRQHAGSRLGAVSDCCAANAMLCLCFL